MGRAEAINRIGETIGNAVAIIGCITVFGSNGEPRRWPL
jgi:hypothetical protein